MHKIDRYFKCTFNLGNVRLQTEQRLGHVDAEGGGSTLRMGNHVGMLLLLLIMMVLKKSSDQLQKEARLGVFRLSQGIQQRHSSKLASLLDLAEQRPNDDRPDEVGVHRGGGGGA